MADAPKKKGSKVPKPVIIGVAVLGAYLLYRWYENRSSSSSSTPTATPDASGTAGYDDSDESGGGGGGGGSPSSTPPAATGTATGTGSDYTGTGFTGGTDAFDPSKTTERGTLVSPGLAGATAAVEGLPAASTSKPLGVRPTGARSSTVTV
jgi:hypothetical protein